MLLFEVVGKAFKVAPEQIAATCVNVGVTTGLILIVTLFEVAGEPIKQGVAFDVISQVIRSPFANEPEVYVALFCPGTTTPLFFQTYTGELPPFVATAVNVIELPAQLPVGDAEMETLAERIGLTVIVIVSVEGHWPVVGLNVYVVVAVLFKAGDHVPVMLLFDVVGSVFNVSPEQIAAT
jgi:hypothetical protein